MSVHAMQSRSRSYLWCSMLSTQCQQIQFSQAWARPLMSAAAHQSSLHDAFHFTAIANPLNTAQHPFLAGCMMSVHTWLNDAVDTMQTVAMREYLIQAQVKNASVSGSSPRKNHRRGRSRPTSRAAQSSRGKLHCIGHTMQFQQLSIAFFH